MNAQGTRRPSPSSSLALALTLIGSLLAAGRPALAGYTVLNSSGTVQFTVDQEGPGTVSPVFAANGMLVSPGGRFFPSLGPVLNSSPVFSQNNISARPLTASESGLVNFGRGHVGGIRDDAGHRRRRGRLAHRDLFDKPTFVQSSSDPATQEFASVSVSQATATFLYTGSPVTVTPGVFLNLTGTSARRRAGGRTQRVDPGQFRGGRRPHAGRARRVKF